MEEYELVEREDFSVKNIDQECIDDIEEARSTYKDLITEGMSNLQMANDIIKDTAHPRSIEVFANLINTISSINGKLVDLQMTKRDITRKESKQEAIPGSVTNNLFVGSPADLLALIKNQ